MAETRAQAYKQKLDALVRDAQSMPISVRSAVLKQLEDANREILAAIASSGPSSYSTTRLQALRGEVTRIMQQFQQAATADVAKAETAAYASSVKSVDAVVHAAYGNIVVPPIVDTKTIAVAQGYTADMISGLSSETASKINAAIQRGAMGKSNLGDLVNTIGRALDGGKFSGIFSQTGDRALSIATHEVMMIDSLASHARISELADHHPGLMKEWVHIPVAMVPRPSHLIANSQTRKPDEPFHVGGEDLMYPRDPSGSPENTIFCHCLQRPKVAPEMLKATDRERALLKSAGIRILVS
jgi:hypothetical protein